MSTTITELDPLGPLSFIVRVMTGLLVTLIVAGTLVTAFGSGTFLGFGGSDVCVTSASSGTGVRFKQVRVVPPVRSRPGIRVAPETFSICDGAPTLALRVMSSVPGGVELVFFAGFLALGGRVLRRAQATGLFSDAVARTITVLGAYLLGGAVVAPALVAMAREMVVRHAAAGAGWHVAFVAFGPSLPTLIAAFGVITVGRVMHRAVAMQHDIDATI